MCSLAVNSNVDPSASERDQYIFVDLPNGPVALQITQRLRLCKSHLFPTVLPYHPRYDVRPNVLPGIIQVRGGEQRSPHETALLISARSQSSHVGNDSS